MDTCFFLAANSRSGFCSLYEGFPENEGVFLHIIKGGPGTGKSGFMRRIAATAGERGMDTEQIICSGDPDSLDALYVPELGQAWIDGTAPHVREPRAFAVDADYVNLGRFCRTPLNTRDSESAAELNAAYRKVYAGAYRLLSAAGETANAYDPAWSERMPEDDRELVRRIVDRMVEGRTESGPALRRRFLSANSCRGRLRLKSTVEKLCKQIYVIDDADRGANALLKTALQEAQEKGMSVILCPDPLEPDRAEAVLLPGCSAAIVAGDWGFAGAEKLKTAAADSFSRTSELSEGQRITERLLSAAYGKLAQAKALHDALESVYRPYMDFAALTEYTDSVIEKLFM